MKIDIGVCVHNRPKDTKAFFDSLLHCISSDYRLFVFDDASDQETQDLIKEYCNKYQFIHLRSDENVGNVRGKRILLETMESKYIVQTDNDIVLSKHNPDILQQQIHVLDNCPSINCIVPRVSDIPERGDPKKIVLSTNEIFPGVLRVRMYGCLFQMHRRQALLKVKAYILPTKNKWDSYEIKLASALKNRYGMLKNIWIMIQDTDENYNYTEDKPHGNYNRIKNKSFFRCIIADKETLEPLWHKDGAPQRWWQNPKYYRKFKGGFVSG